MDIRPDGYELRVTGYTLAALACTIVLAFAVFSFHDVPGIDDIDHASVVFEGFLAVLPALGLFQVAGLQQANRLAYWFLFAGLSALALSMTTDTLDELVELPVYYNTVFEGLFQVAGFLLLLLGLHVWIRWNDAMRQQLTELATTDYLTGIANRRHFMQLLQYQAALSDRTGSPLSLIMIDLDHFKEVNDSLGHDAGDRELIGMVKLVRKRFRKSDNFARIGGEEFALMAPSTGVDEAVVLAEKLRREVERAGLVEQPHLTASFGVAQHESGESVGNLLKRVDEAMYRAKASGRNCVMRADTA